MAQLRPDRTDKVPRSLPRTATSDRNLLVGVLALQLDFINRDQLISAMNAWVLEKTKTVEQILLIQGTIESDTAALLHTLVEKHLQIHQRRAEESLAAVGLIGRVFDELKAIGDCQIEESLTILASNRGVNDAALPVSDMKEPDATTVGHDSGAENVLQFRILRYIAQGGLGKISIALDERLNREVAIKEIKDSLAHDPGSRTRFHLEAEITAKLQHPGVVPVYGMGRFPDGRPFYAMRFVGGESLKQAISVLHSFREDAGYKRKLRRLLTRFVSVCGVIEYAHARGVLHRDIKPANIMLGAYGETLVIDWGLAETIKDVPNSDNVKGRGNGLPTEHLDLVGTPPFMAPEQAGGSGQAGPLSDVFSLGATLYCILTGRVPFNAENRREIMERVRSCDFARPRDINPKIPRALEAICLKAMSAQPQQRYVSPIKMAEDIECWFAEELVSSYSEGLKDRLQRWVREHASLVGSITTLMLLLLTASAAINLTSFNVNRASQSRIAVLKSSREEHRRLAQDHLRRAGKTETELAEAHRESESTRSQLAAVKLKLSYRDRAYKGLQESERSLRKRSAEIRKHALDLASESERLTNDYQKALEETRKAEVELSQAQGDLRMAKARVASSRFELSRALRFIDSREAQRSTTMSTAARQIAVFSKVIEARPTDARALHYRALAYSQLEQWQNAINDLNASIKIDPTGADRYLDRGRIHRALKQWQKVLDDYDRAVRLEPKEPLALLDRAWLRATCPDPLIRSGEKAKDDAQSAKRLLREPSWWAIQCLAAGHAESGEFDQAIQLQAKSLAMKARMSNAQRLKALDCLSHFKAKKPYRDGTLGQ